MRGLRANSTPSEQVMVPAACFPPIRKGDQGDTSLPGNTILPTVINTTAKSGSKWEAALFPKTDTCMEFSEQAAVLGILSQGSSYFY